jgi:hypothetical protein
MGRNHGIFVGLVGENWQDTGWDRPKGRGRARTGDKWKGHEMEWLDAKLCEDGNHRRGWTHFGVELANVQQKCMPKEIRGQKTGWLIGWMKLMCSFE